MNLRTGLLSILVLGLLAGCGGGGDDLITEDGLRTCLADRGLQSGGAQGTSASLASVSPDFSMTLTPEGELDVVVEGSDAKARRAAADIRAALASFGVPAPDQRIVTRRNAIAVFDRAPSAGERENVSSCFD